MVMPPCVSVGIEKSGAAAGLNVSGGGMRLPFSCINRTNTIHQLPALLDHLRGILKGFVLNINKVCYI